MSLINEALKKAQRQRAAEAAATTPGTPAAPVAKRAEPKSANTVVLIGAGAVVLVVISVVVTVFLLNRPAAPTTAPAAPTTSPAPKAATDSAPPPVIIAPTIKAPAPTPEPAPTPRDAAPQGSGNVATAAPTETNPVSPPPAVDPKQSTTPATQPPVADTKSTPAPKETPPQPKATPPPAEAAPPAAPVAAATPPAAPKADERVQAFVDGLRVTAVRPVGNESRVLMNERVYRVNEIVDRGLGVRLIKVAQDSLTFSDANGVTYVKNL